MEAAILDFDVAIQFLKRNLSADGSDNILFNQHIFFLQSN